MTDEKNARLPEGKASTKSNIIFYTNFPRLVRLLDTLKNPSAIGGINVNTAAADLIRGVGLAAARENSNAATGGTDRTDRSPLRFRSAALPPTDKTDGSALVSVVSVPPRALFAKMRLQSVNPPAYTFCVAETTATEIGVSNCIGGQPPTGGIFSSAASARLQWSGLGGGALAHAGSYAPVRQPRHVPGHPNWRWGRVTQPSIGGRTMRHVLARPEQTQSPTEFANSAAALAPTVFDALDMLADALQSLAVLQAEEGVRHV